MQKDEEGWDNYKNFVKVTDIFSVNSIGIVTSRDDFVIDNDKQTLENRIRNFIYSNDSDDFIKQAFELKENKIWRVSKAKATLRDVPDWEKHIHKILYRPFDERWIFYHASVIERSRREVMTHLLQDNLALLVKRQQKQHFSYAFVSNLITESCVFESAYANNTVLPLYLYDSRKQQSLLRGGYKSQNINWSVLPGWMATIQSFTSPVTDNFVQPAEAIFYYIYAILYSNIYREKYQEFLKSDFPRIPFTSDYKTFQQLAVLGEQLVELHSLKSKLLDHPASRYEGKGDDRIEKRDYHEDSNRLYINGSQFFDKVSPEVWNYFIGGYQVLDKWLKDRTGRVLSLEDQLHFRKVLTALTETIDIQKRIDKFYPEVEKSLVNSSLNK